MTMKKNILYIHGANMSPVSFTLIQTTMGSHNAVAPEYSIENPVDKNVKRIARLARKEFKDEPFDIISHSLGGIIAILLLRTRLHIGRIVTISTPLGGSEAAASLRYMYPRYQLYKDIDPNSDIIKKANNQKLKVPVLSVITTGGNSSIPFMKEDNDTIVTVASQTASDNPEFYYVDLNHFEVLLSEEVAEKIKLFLDGETKRNYMLPSLAMKDLLSRVRSFVK
jgi:pimeloyl-ACP methyl ester carboxylesterase